MQDNYSQRSNQIRSSEIREILKVTERPDIISFAGGLPAPELFPVEEMREACNLVLQKEKDHALQYSTTEGYRPLREWIANRLRQKGVYAVADDILILTGSQQGLDLSAKVFIDEGDIIVCESPTYLAALQAFRAFGPRFVSVDMDENGMVMSHLEQVLSENKVKLIYTVPDFQNPTGRTMSLERRKKLVELAERFGVIVVEDNPYGELRFAGKELPPVKAFDITGRVVYLSTFSKILAPGLRIGWVCTTSAEHMSRYIILKQGTDLHTDSFSQMITHQYLIQNDIDQHIREIRKVYGARRNLMLDTMHAKFPAGIRYTHPEGGLFLWVELPEGMDAKQILHQCIEEKIAFVPGEPFFTNGKGKNTFRLNFSNMADTYIVEGIEKLGKILQQFMK
ncbi:PLP-dependent aminotransferase family protein [Anaerotruncus rubiinfantis]|uniref:aminotransferase-like domain-containing protein n=1 Tax=Anaerotruncus rubiinfantis TaxID=1720200 RepID=UPI0011C9829F|nr:PLP-dependent aminotransferase family protein [Anaerotruncus rubiinfantis]